MGKLFQAITTACETTAQIIKEYLDSKTATLTNSINTARDELTRDINDATDNVNRLSAGIEADLSQRDRVVNLLDNSDGSRFVAQAGLGGSHGAQAYAGDRWKLDRGSISGTSNGDGSYRDISLAAGTRIQQIIANQELLYGKTWTAAVWLVNGTVVIASGAINGAASADWDTPIGSNPINGVSLHVQAGTGDDLRYRFLVSADVDATILAMALIPGSYTADTLPEYQPKGYAAELVECMRYYQCDNRMQFIPSLGSSDYFKILNVGFFVPMRITPTVTASASVTEVQTACTNNKGFEARVENAANIGSDTPAITSWTASADL